MPKPLLIFDFDGTLADSIGHIVVTLQGACRAHGAPAPTSIQVKSHMGLSLSETIQGILPDEFHHLIHPIMQQYEKDFRSQATMKKTYLFDGIQDMLARLATQANLAIATGKTRGDLEAVMKNMPELAKLFSSLHTASDGPGKPHPAMINAAIKAIGVDRAYTLMVGDATFDMAMARTAKVYAIGVTWGTMAREDLMQAGADIVVDTVAELETVINNFMWRSAKNL